MRRFEGRGGKSGLSPCSLKGRSSRTRIARQLLAGVLVVSAIVSGCRRPGPLAEPAAEPAAETEVAELLAAFNRGGALMEQYRYSAAAEQFETVVRARPQWTAARFNLGLAYLNMQGERDAKDSIDIARDEFQQILEAEPDHVAALFCLGMYYQYLGETERSLEFFSAAHQRDSADPHVAYKFAETLLGLDRNDQGTAVLEQLVENNPGFVSAIYRLAMQYRRAGLNDQALPLLDRFRQLQAGELAGGSHAVQTAYGAAGKYYRLRGADDLPVEVQPPDPQRVVFSPDVRHLDVMLQAWDWSGGAVTLPGIAVADVDQDGDLDLCLTGHDEQGSARLWLNDGAGTFTAGPVLVAGVVSPCFGDVDNDGHVDLWLGCAGQDLLLINDGRGQYSPAAEANLGGPSTLTQLARLVDLDSDGDLDLLSFRAAQADVPVDSGSHPSPSSIFRSNRDGTFADEASAWGLQLPDVPVACVLLDDLDNDYDLDLIVFPAGGPPQVWINDRGGAFRMREGPAVGLSDQDVIGAISGDPDKDGDRDLLLFTASGLRLMKNDGRGRFQADEQFAAAHGRLGGSGGQFVDMDNDGDLDIVLADARRRDGSRGPVLLINQWPQQRFVDAAELDPGLLLTAIDTGGPASCVVADFTGNGLCDILLAVAGRQPMLLENVTAGGNWLQLDLAGTRPADNKARSNRSAIGARVEVKTGAVFQQYLVGGSSGPVAMPPLRIHAGLGEHTRVEWLRVIWPDAVLQAELELAANRVLVVEELNRKTSSCPYLFAWTGSCFEFVADFGGVGGLGYLLQPGVYAPPDPTEYLPLPDLEPLDGDYVLQAITPLEEVTYLDEARLLAVDHPLGTRICPNEMMAVGIAPPEFELYCFEETIEPIAAVDHRGADVTDTLRQVDRRYAGATDPDHRFTGLAAEHCVELDFGDPLAGRAAEDRLVLILHGWVEYGYSSTNYAAHQAGLSGRAPTIQVQRGGKWVDLFREVGYPAGVNHVMALEMTGHLQPGDRYLRIHSNMELYWDRIFLAVHRPAAAVRIQEIAPRSADLHFLGYPREYSPDGGQPNLADYNNIDRTAAWKLMAGHYTRYGEVAELLAEADDCFVIMGHGEETTLRFSADAFGPVPEGFRRSFLLKIHSYCKDMDLYTAHPDTVEPLPFRAMSGYPYGPDESYPDTEQTRRYRQHYNTRQVLP